MEAKRLLDEEGCSAVPSRTQLIAGPSKTMLTSLNTRVFNKEMQGKTHIYVCQRNVYAIIHTKKVYCVSIRYIINIFIHKTISILAGRNMKKYEYTCKMLHYTNDNVSAMDKNDVHVYRGKADERKN